MNSHFLSFSNYCGVRRILPLGYSQKKKKSILAGMIYTVACVLQSPTAKLAISCSRTLFQNYGERTSRGCYLSPISHPPPFSPNYTSLPSPPLSLSPPGIEIIFLSTVTYSTRSSSSRQHRCAIPSPSKAWYNTLLAPYLETTVGER